MPESVLAQLAGWFDDYNSQAPHSALGVRSPREYRALTLPMASETTTASPYLAQDARSTAGPLSGYPPKSGDSRRADT
jgi:integrase-like protein